MIMVAERIISPDCLSRHSSHSPAVVRTGAPSAGVKYQGCGCSFLAVFAAVDAAAIETGRDILAMRDQHEDPVAHRGAPANVLVPVLKTGSSTLPRYALKSSNELQRALRNPCPTMRSTPA
jgi:hypothetical protein